MADDRSEEGRDGPSLDPDTSVIVLVHGIRTHAQWMTAISSSLSDNGFTVVATNYERFDAFRFWVPIGWIRRLAVRHVWTDIRRAMQIHEGKKISIIAHSYGTYIVTQILQSEFDFSAHRLIFCGSVVPRRFAFEQIGTRFQSPILNEIGTKDFWPLVAKCATWGYDSSGTYGFMRPDVIDRQHEDFSHSDFLNAEFCKKYWIPFLLEGEIVPTDNSVIRPPFWARVCSFLPAKYVAVVAILAGLWFAFDDKFVAIAPTISAQIQQTIEDTLSISKPTKELSSDKIRNTWLAGMGFNACFQTFAESGEITLNVRGLIAQTQPHFDRLGIPVSIIEEFSKQDFLRVHSMPLMMRIPSTLEALYGPDISTLYEIAQNIGPTTGAMERYVSNAEFRKRIIEQDIGIEGLVAALEDPIQKSRVVPPQLEHSWQVLVDKIQTGNFDASTTQEIYAWRDDFREWATKEN